MGFKIITYIEYNAVRNRGLSKMAWFFNMFDFVLGRIMGITSLVVVDRSYKFVIYF